MELIGHYKKGKDYYYMMVRNPLNNNDVCIFANRPGYLYPMIMQSGFLLKNPEIANAINQKENIIQLPRNINNNMSYGISEELSFYIVRNPIFNAKIMVIAKPKTGEILFDSFCGQQNIKMTSAGIIGFMARNIQNNNFIVDNTGIYVINKLYFSHGHNPLPYQ